MSDKPIIFSGPMVRAILEGHKTMTRRVLKNVPPMPEARCHPNHQQKHPSPYLDAYCGQRKTKENPRGMGDWWNWWQVDDRACLPQFKVGYAPGDRLWVRERFNVFTYSQDGEKAWPVEPLPAKESFDEINSEACRYVSNVHYHATPINKFWHDEKRWRPSIHMPRWASRLTLIVETVKVERLQDISRGDAIAEGPPKICKVPSFLDGGIMVVPDLNKSWVTSTPRTWFRDLWDSINAKRAGCAWADNPWVAAITFRAVKANIDSPEASQ